MHKLYAQTDILPNEMTYDFSKREDVMRYASDRKISLPVKYSDSLKELELSHQSKCDRDGELRNAAYEGADGLPWKNFGHHPENINWYFCMPIKVVPSMSQVVVI